MKRTLLILGLAACCGLAGVHPALACGDKIVDVSQGVKFQRAMGMTTATILIYVDAERLERPVKRLRASLSRVGHEVALVTDWQMAIEALRTGEFDLLIAEMEALGRAQSELGAASTPRHLIPFVLDGSAAELGLAKEVYSHALALPGRDSEQILTVQASLDSHEPAASST